MVRRSYLHCAVRCAMVPHCLLIQNGGIDQAAKVSQGHSISRGGHQECSLPMHQKRTEDEVKIRYLFSKRSRFST